MKKTKLKVDASEARKDFAFDRESRKNCANCLQSEANERQSA